jgi:hypothetical protein
MRIATTAPHVGNLGIVDPGHRSLHHGADIAETKISRG